MATQRSSPPSPPPFRPTLADGVRAKLEQLEQLHDRGVLTDEEFASQKGRLLAG